MKPVLILPNSKFFLIRLINCLYSINLKKKTKKIENIKIFINMVNDVTNLKIKKRFSE